MSQDYHLLRLLIREEMEYYGTLMKNMGSSSSGEVEIDHRLEELQSIEGQIQQLEIKKKVNLSAWDESLQAQSY